MKRIFTFDIIRAVAIIGVVFVHTIQHTWALTNDVEGGTEEPGVMVLFLFYLLTMAGLFYVVMGAVNSYMMYHRLTTKRNTRRQMILSGIIMGVFLIFSHYIFRYLFSADSGILYWYVREGEYIEPAAKWIVGTSTLAMLGWTAILIPLILSFLFIGEGIKRMRRNFWILGLSATAIIFLTPLVRDALAPYVVTWILEGKYLPAVALGAFVYDLFPIFPYIAYGMYGSIIGIALAKQSSFGKVRYYLLLLGTFWMVVGWIGVSQYGGLDPTLYRAFSHTAIFNKTSMQVSQLGLFLVLVYFGLVIFDRLTPERRKNRQKRFDLIQKFALVSLTIYLVEGFIWSICIRGFSYIPAMDGWRNSLGIVALAALLHVLMWALIVQIWDRVKYAGSVEWMVLKLIEIISGKRSEKFNIKRDMILKKAPSMVKEERPRYMISKRK